VPFVDADDPLTALGDQEPRGAGGDNEERGGAEVHVSEIIVPESARSSGSTATGFPNGSSVPMKSIEGTKRG